jgi:tetratricopeptide (TPR) repeat protein
MVPGRIGQQLTRHSIAERNGVFFLGRSLADREPLPKDFVERVTQTADAWWSIDPDPTFACQRAARLLQLVGMYDNAWEYWTTPLANTANSSDAWKSLALALAATNQVHRASQAWDEAFAAEPTDPELLWNHATLLRDHNQPEHAKKLLTQIMNGKWQPSFNHFKSKAKSLMQKLGSSQSVVAGSKSERGGMVGNS